MKGKTRKILSTLLTLAMVFGLFAGIPMTAGAAGSTDNLIDLDDFVGGVWNGPSSADGWEYNGFDPTVGEHEFSITAGKEVNITGSATLFDGNYIDIEIGTGATVEWDAELFGYYGSGGLVCPYGDGDFEMTGGKIVNRGYPFMNGIYNDNLTGDLTISGGVVFCLGDNISGAVSDTCTLSDDGLFIVWDMEGWGIAGSNPGEEPDYLDWDCSVGVDVDCEVDGEILTVSWSFDNIVWDSFEINLSSYIEVINFDDGWFGNDDIGRTNWEYTESTNTIEIYDDVIIIGTVTGATDTLNIDIDYGATVEWRADYDGAPIGSRLIDITGTGFFVMSSGSIDQSSGGRALQGSNIIINGGTVKAANSGAISGTYVTITNGTVENNSSNDTIVGSAGSASVTVSGGTVRNLGSGNTINNTSATGTINISGTAQVSSVNGVAINSSNYVIISGGEVKSTGTGTAINAAGQVTLEGGTVTANTGSAIKANRIEAVDDTTTVTGAVDVSAHIYAYNDGELLINGDVSLSGGSAAIYTGMDISTATAVGIIDITGDVTFIGDFSRVVAEDGGLLTITGGVTFRGESSGVVAANTGSVITVDGNVDFTDGTDCYIDAETGGYIYFMGDVTDGIVLEIWNGTKTLDTTVGDPTDTDVELGAPYGGYYWDEYTDGTSYVYIRQGVAAETTIDLSESWFGDHDNDDYPAYWKYDFATNTIYVYEDVIIIGNVPGRTTTLNINIAAGKTVTWTASYSGNVIGFLIDATSGTGDFVMSGGSIENTNPGGGVALRGNTITVNGSSRITAASGHAINGSAVTINNGTIETNGAGSAYSAINGMSDTVTVNGGTVRNNGNGNAITVTTGTVNLAGGTVTANTGTAIDAGEIEVTGTATVENSAGASNPAIVAGDLFDSAATCNLTVNGNVEVAAGGVVQTNDDGKITINGNVKLIGPYSQFDSLSTDSVLTVNGNVEFTGTGSLGAGNGGKMYITGDIIGITDIYISDDGSFIANIPVGTPTTANGLTYDGYYWDIYTATPSVNPQSYVYVRQASITPPTPAIAITSTGLGGSLKVGDTVTGSIIYTLSNGTYATPITPADFAVTGLLPPWITTGAATWTDANTVTVTITLKPTAVSSAVTIPLPTSIPARNVTGATVAITPTGSVTTSEVVKGDGAAVSGAPTVSGTPTQTSITVGTVTNAGTTGQAVQYAISTVSGTTPTTGWQSGTTFTGLTAGTTYYVYARTAENTNYNAGAALVSAAIVTAPLTYAVTVNSGSGGGSYAAGAIVTITAAAAPSGQVFDKWTTADGVTFVSDTSATTSFTMPAKAVTVTATYKAITYTVTVTNGTGGGSFAAGATVSITAAAAPSGQEFDKWTTADGVTFASESATTTTFIMPGKNVTVTATYKLLAPDFYAVNVQNDGNGTAYADVTSAKENVIVNITAVPNPGYDFDEWVEVSSVGITFDNENDAITTFEMPDDNVTVMATFTAKATFAITVTGGVSNKASTYAGDTVTVTAGTAPAGQVFSGWTTTTPSVTFANASNASTTFTMPASAVSITANYTAVTYAVTISGGGTGASGAGSYTAGATVSIEAGTRSGYNFSGWTSASPGVSFANASNASTTFSMPANAVTVTANWTQTSVTTPPGGSYTGGGGAGSTPAAATVPAGDGTVSVTYTMSGGVATLTLPDSKVTEIIGKAKDGKAIFDLSKVTGATGATMPKAALTQLAGAGLAVEVKLPQGTVAFSAAAAASIAAQAGGANVTVSLSQVNQSTLTAAQRAAIKPGDLVFNISVMSGTQVITNFDGTITVTVPYTGSLPVAVWYLNAAGELEKLNSIYDAATKTVTFTTNHLSLYVVGLDNEPTPITPTMPVNPFSDVFGTDWFINDVIYAYSKGLIAGTTPTTFAPNSNLKYSEAITLAARMHELYTTGEVTLENDDDLWYQTYVDYAVENGIIGSDDEYDWNATATRAGYMQIFAKALPDEAFKAINSVPDGSIPDVSMNYPGAAAIYKLYRAGILQGNDDAHTCNPDANIRRSEVAAILTRMMNPDVRIEFSI